MAKKITSVDELQVGVRVATVHAYFGVIRKGVLDNVTDLWFEIADGHDEEQHLRRRHLLSDFGIRAEGDYLGSENSVWTIESDEDLAELRRRFPKPESEADRAELRDAVKRAGATGWVADFLI